MVNTNSKKNIFYKINIFFKKNVSKKIILSILVRFQKLNAFNLYLNYHPDSYGAFKKHPEFTDIFDRFIKFNTLNNAPDIARLWSFILNIKQIIEENIEGDFAEVGVWRGNTAAILAHIALQHKRKLFLFDTFQGFDKRDIKGVDIEKPIEFNDTSISMAKEVIGEAAEVCEFVIGYFPDSLSAVHKRIYSVVSLDCDLYEPMKAGLHFFYPLMPKGGLFLLHDYSGSYWEGAKKAIDEFCKENNEFVVLIADKSGSAFVRKTN